jgi:methionyl-tRNA formyltransferase
MRLTVFTSNQPRHLACLEALTGAGHEVHAVIEPKSWCPGQNSEVLTRYWGYVQAAERIIFGSPRPIKCPTVVLPMGEVSKVVLPSAVMDTDQFIVFGSSFIKGALADELVEKGALNLHVGIAPEYRGSACVFWAAYDDNYEYVGAQVQRLGRGVDSGRIVYETKASGLWPDPFERGMRVVQAGIYGLLGLLERHPDTWLDVRPNDPAQTIRYSRGADFTEKVAAEYLERLGR